MNDASIELPVWVLGKCKRRSLSRERKRNGTHCVWPPVADAGVDEEGILVRGVATERCQVDQGHRQWRTIKRH